MVESAAPLSDPARRLPAGIWALGFVSLLMDVSSEMIHSLLPMFLVSVLGASALTVGLIEGAAEATALIVEGLLGRALRLSRQAQSAGGDRLRDSARSRSRSSRCRSSHRRGAPARLIDRVGKGIRGAPRDALIADIAPPRAARRAFGLRQSLDTVGAFVGPLLAVALMLVWANDFRAVFWVAVIPGALAVALLIFGVREPERASDGDAARQSDPLGEPAAPRRAYWWVVAIGACLHAGALQRGVPGAARAAGRACASRWCRW